MVFDQLLVQPFGLMRALKSRARCGFGNVSIGEEQTSSIDNSIFRILFFTLIVLFLVWHIVFGDIKMSILKILEESSDWEISNSCHATKQTDPVDKGKCGNRIWKI